MFFSLMLFGFYSVFQFLFWSSSSYIFRFSIEFVNIKNILKIGRGKWAVIKKIFIPYTLRGHFNTFSKTFLLAKPRSSSLEAPAVLSVVTSLFDFISDIWPLYIKLAHKMSLWYLLAFTQATSISVRGLCFSLQKSSFLLFLSSPLPYLSSLSVYLPYTL